MKKTRLGLIIISALFYLLALIFFICLSVGMIEEGRGEIIDTIGSILFLIMSIGIGSIAFFIPFIIALTSLILTIKLNNNGGKYSKGFPIALTILPVLTEVSLVSFILIFIL